MKNLMKKLIGCAAATLALLAVLGGPKFLLAAEPHTTLYGLKLSGNQFLTRCQSELFFSQGMCIGYLTGISDGLALVNTFTKGTKNIWAPICMPEKVPVSQLRSVILKYLKDHPERRHEGITILVTDAMRKAWPCK
jgi:hypothetical protein